MSRRKQDNLIDWSVIASKIHKGMAQLQEEDCCTDFVIEVGNKSFRCHKAVIASVSDYFKALFSSGMRETEQRKVVLDDVSPDSFQIVMNILYPSDDSNLLDNIEETDMADLLKLSGRFQMSLLQDICLRYYKRTMSSTNCIARWKMGEEIFCKELSEAGFQFILDNFEDMSTDNILVSLKFVDFHSIVKNESLYVPREDMVWSAIRNWIRFDWENRSVHAAELMRECSLTEIDPDFVIEEIAFDPVVRQSDAASKLVQEAVKYRRHPGMHGDIELKSRNCHEKRQTTFVILREIEDDAEATFTTRDVLMGFAIRSDNVWRISMDRLLGDSVGRSSKGISCCVHGESVYILNENKHRGSKLLEYDSSKNSWKCLRDMDLPLIGHSMCAADGCLYVIGGRSTLEMNVQVWQYTMESNSWMIIGEILAPVVSASTVCVNNKIYVFGGELDSSIPADCVQTFDTETNVGTILCNLPKPCRWSRAIVRGMVAYIVTSDGDIVKVFLESGESTIIASMSNFDRVNFGICLRQNELQVFGGLKRNTDDRGDVKNQAIGDFVVDISKGDVKTSRWLHKAACKNEVEVLASVSVVLDTSRLPQQLCRYQKLSKEKHTL